MRINESKIRQIIREEARRVLREGGDDEQKHKDRIASFETGYEFGHDDAEEELSGGALEISRAEWFDLYNDASSSSQGGEIEIDYSKGDGTRSATITVSSYTESESYIVERISDELSVSEDEARAALGSKLNDIMRELENSDRIYQQDAGW